MSVHYKQVKYFYDTFVNGERLWSIERVRNAVVKEWITAEEFKEITSEGSLRETINNI